MEDATQSTDFDAAAVFLKSQAFIYSNPQSSRVEKYPETETQRDEG